MPNGNVLSPSRVAYCDIHDDAPAAETGVIRSMKNASNNILLHIK
jgi:hypothetical protein